MRCFSCNEPLNEGENFYSYENNSYCENCFDGVLKDVMDDIKNEAERAV